MRRCTWYNHLVSSRAHTHKQYANSNSLSTASSKAPRAWHSKITQCLHQIGFEMSRSDNSLYIRSDSKGQVFIKIYVDDLVIGGEHLANIENIRNLLSGQFEMNDMKELHYFLGIEVIETRDGILISQWHYILNLLFRMTKCKPVTTPLDRNLKVDAEFGTKECWVNSLSIASQKPNLPHHYSTRPQLHGWPSYPAVYVETTKHSLGLC